MAIKIIKPGKQPKQKKQVYKITCPVCGCVFEAEDADFISIERRLDGNCTIICPTCGREITVSRQSLDSREE